jgi:hypothetical protein
MSQQDDLQKLLKESQQKILAEQLRLHIEEMEV